MTCGNTGSPVDSPPPALSVAGVTTVSDSVHLLLAHIGQALFFILSARRDSMPCRSSDVSLPLISGMPRPLPIKMQATLSCVSFFFLLRDKRQPFLRNGPRLSPLLSAWPG